MRRITDLGYQDNALYNDLILELTEKSAKDADVLKNLTMLASIYLPAMFVAVIPMFIQSFLQAQISPSLFVNLWLASS